MKWLEIGRYDFVEAVRECRGVCAVPLGSIEAHGDHLPLGTDSITIEEIVSRAAAIEPVVEFPAQYFGMVPEVRHQPGSVVTPVSLLLLILENVCAEVSRNGLKKIILVNGHGGNIHLNTFAVSRLENHHDYTVYLYKDPGCGPEWDAMSEGSDGHAGEVETSTMLYLRPELVKMELIPKAARQGLPRLSDVHKHNLSTGFDWYAANPDHYNGDAAPSNREKGEYLVKSAAEQLAVAFRSVKDDSAGPEILQEFYAAAGLSG